MEGKHSMYYPKQIPYLLNKEFRENIEYKEYNVKEEQILGIMEGFYRDDKYIDTSSSLYRLYVYLWCFSLSFRKIILSILYRIRYLKNVKK